MPLESVKTIALPAWMDMPELRTLMATLNQGQGRALMVGGCVRNALMGTLPTDVDIAATWTPEEATARLEEAGIKVVPTGIDHGTVTAVVEGKGFEITTLRRDVETDGRRAVVAFTQDWAEDAQRRDFTLNTLLADLEGHIYDPTGQGLADLEAGRVVFVGAAAERIAEDYLRILRFFRFHAWYGKGEPDALGLKACAAAAGKIPTLSKERITQEVLKLLAAPGPVHVLEIMKQNRILPELFHVKYNPSILESYVSYQNTDPAAALFILGGMQASHMETLESRMTFSGAVKKMYLALAQAASNFSDISEKSVKELVYRNNNAFALQVLQVCGVQDPALLKLAAEWAAPKFPVSGEDLMKKGYSEGPELGAKLKELEARWIAEGYPSTFKY